MPFTTPKTPGKTGCCRLNLAFGAAFLLLGFASRPLWAAGESVTFLSPTSPYASVTYSTQTGSSNVLTFNVEAQNAGVSDGSFQDVVNVGLYDTATGLPAQPQGVWVPNGSGPVTGGVVPMTFVHGKLDFGVTLTAGSNSMDVSITDGSTALTGNTYPGPISMLSGPGYPGYQCRGFFTSLYTEPSSGTTVATVYVPSPTPGSTDLLLASASATAVGSFNPIPVTVADSNSVTNALCFAVTGFNGGYAAGGAGVSVYLAFERQNNATGAPVSYEVIMDYGNAPSGPLTDYNNPRTAYDSVYFGSANVNKVYDGGSNPAIVQGSVTAVGGYASPQPFMNNGQVIFRVWTGASAGQTVYLWWANGGGGDYSYVTFPYSKSNVQPLRSSITIPSTGTPTPSIPVTVLGANPVTLLDTFFNQFNSSVTQISFQVPPNNPASGTYWSFSSVGVPGGGNFGTVNSNPTVSSPGTITVNCQGSPVTSNGSLVVTLTGTASGQDGSWPMSIVGALNTFNSQVPTDSSQAVVDTLGVPDKPGSFSAVPANYPGTGGQISLSWSASVSENPQGYVITRSPGGGSLFANSVTLPSGLVVNNAVTLGTTSYLDSSAVNLTDYTYSLQSFNYVAQSAATGVGPVTAYANPGAPGPVTALTGGTTVQLNWAAPSSVLGSFAVTGYQVWRDTQPSLATAVTIASVAGLTYSDKGLAPGSYYYALASMDSQYSGGAPGSTHISGFSVTVSGNPPGNPPTGLTATLTNSNPATIQLTWTGPANVLNTPLAGYEVSRAVTTGSFAPLTFLASGGSPATINDTAVTIGSYYPYEVQAVDSAGVTSNFSSPVTGRIGPAAPVSLSASASNAGVTLTWPAVPNSAGETVYNYVVDQINGATTVAFSAVTAVPNAALTDTTPLQGVNYVYQVAGVDQIGVTGGFSEAVTSALLPLVPSAFAVAVSQTGVSFIMDLTWSAPVSAGNVTAYNIRDSGVTNSFGFSAFYGSFPLNPQPVTFSVPAASAGTTEFFWIRGVDPGGGGVSIETGLQLPPNPPTGLGASSTATTITLNWNPVLAEGVTYYTVYRSTNPTSGYVNIATSPTASFNDGTAVAGTDYYYEISATNAGDGVTIPGGESLLSTSVESALAPAVPVGLTATLNPASDYVTLGWTSQSGSEANLQSYTLYRTINGGTPVTLQTAPPSVIAYTDTFITSANAGATVLYYLFATNTGLANSTPEGPVGLQIPPNPPTGIGASPSSTAVTVNWTAIAGQGVSQYTIYREPLGGSFAAVGTATPGTANSFPDSGSLSEGTTYVYYLTATNPGGTGFPGGTSLPSASVTSGLGPVAPTGLGVAAINTSNDIAVNWTAVTIAVPNATAVSLLVNNVNNPATASATQLAASVTSFSDNGVFTASVTGESPDTTYYYWLETLNTFGPSSPSLPASQLTYPAPVTLNTVSAAPDGISRILNFNTVGNGDVAQYVFYRELQGASNFVSVGNAAAQVGPSMSVTLTNPLSPGQDYLYCVEAVNATGTGASATTLTYGSFPSAPSPVTVVSGVSNLGVTVNLSWGAVTGQNVTGYTVYRNTVNSLPYPVSIAVGNVTQYSDGTVTGGTTYYYLVEANSSDGKESLSNTANAVPVTAAAQPNAPTGFLETDGNASVSLGWTAAVSTTFPVPGYNLYDSPSGGATVKANATPVPGLSSVVSGLSNGATYNLWAQAVDSQGNLSPLSAAVTGYPDAPPGVPGNFAGYSGFNSDEAYWNTSAAGSLPVSYYMVERIALTGSVTTFAQVPSNQTGYVDGSASNGSTYVYSVEAVDDSGVTTGSHASGYSNSVTVVTGLIAINPPSQISAQGGINQVALKWTDALGSSSPVTGYQIYRATSISGPFSVLTTAPVTTTEPNLYTDATAVNGTPYYYYFISQASGTTAVSADSATILGIPAPPPAAPTSVINTDGNASVTLNWTASPNEGAVTIAQYVINRAILPAASAALTATSGPVTDFLDNSGLNNSGETVVYQVEAVNSNGTTGALSAAVTGYPYAPFAPTGYAGIDSSTGVTLSWTAPVSPTWSPLGLYDDHPDQPGRRRGDGLYRRFDFLYRFLRNPGRGLSLHSDRHRQQRACEHPRRAHHRRPLQPARPSRHRDRDGRGPASTLRLAGFRPRIGKPAGFLLSLVPQRRCPYHLAGQPDLVPGQ